MDTKYNYVFFNIADPCYEPVLWPLQKYPFVRVFKHAFNANKLTDKLFFLHWSKKLNRKVNLPFKKAWFSKITKQNFSQNKPCCYVFLGGKYLTEEKGLFEHIKSLNPENKAIILCGDLISRKNWDMGYIKSRCDMVVTYDEGEAKKYQIAHFPWGNLYDATEDVTFPERFENDVYFLGFAKDRLNDIHSAYKALSEQGLRCKFIICGTEEKDRLSGEGLCYSAPISYKENISNVQKSRCILEIIQGDSCAPTLRLREACAYKRKLITNNPNPIYREFICDANLCVYSSPYEVPSGFANSPVNYDGFIVKEENPLEFIRFLEENL